MKVEFYRNTEEDGMRYELRSHPENRWGGWSVAALDRDTGKVAGPLMFYTERGGAHEAWHKLMNTLDKVCP